MLFVVLMSRLNASDGSVTEELIANADRLLPRWILYTGGWSLRAEPDVLASGPPVDAAEGPAPLDAVDS